MVFHCSCLRLVQSAVTPLSYVSSQSQYNMVSTNHKVCRWYIHTNLLPPPPTSTTYDRINMIAWLVNTHAIGITKTTYNIIA